MLANCKLEDLEFGKKLGEGSHGQVLAAEHTVSKRRVAVKKIPKKDLVHKRVQENLKREIRIHEQVYHENIVRLYNSLEDSQYIYLVMEYAAQGALFKIIREHSGFDERTAFYYFIQACSGIYFLHKNGFMHRDLKPENLLVSHSNTLKICDFGGSVEHASGDTAAQRKTFLGTFEYMAPEMVK